MPNTIYEVIISRHGVPIAEVTATMPTPEVAAEAAEFERKRLGLHEDGDTYDASPLGLRHDDALALAVESMCELSPGFAALVTDVGGCTA